MKSKIKIDLDGDNRPVIRITQSKDIEDLRDKTLKRFFEGLEYTSNALFAFPHRDNKEAVEWDVIPYLALDGSDPNVQVRLRAEAQFLLAKAHGFKQIHAIEALYEDSDGNKWWWTGWGFSAEGQKMFIPDNKKDIPKTGNTASDSIAAFAGLDSDK